MVLANVWTCFLFGPSALVNVRRLPIILDRFEGAVLYTRHGLHLIRHRASLQYGRRRAVYHTNAVSENEENIFRCQSALSIIEARNIRVKTKSECAIRGGRQDLAEISKINAASLRDNDLT